MRIGLFGGAFDPPHLGHLMVARILVQQKIVDEVWFVPVKQHPFGKKVEVNGHREVMLKLMIDGESNLKIERFELEHQEKSYSLHTLRSLSEQFPQYSFSWIIGTDNLADFHRWYQYEELLRVFSVIVYPRQGYDFVPMYDGMKAVKNMPEVDVSSTQVRELLKQGKGVTGLVHPAVAQYIQEQGLYEK